MAYTSLFKKDDVRITQAFSSNHKGIDLSRGVVRQPIYLPNRAVSGTVWKILPGYSSGGVYYKDAPIIYVKHKDGSGSRYIHSYPKDVKVKVGDTVVAGQQICCTGNAGHSHGDHLHFEWLTKWDDLNTRIDPVPYVMNDNTQTFKVGDKIVFTGVQNIRKGAGDKFDDIGDTKVGQTATIKDGPRTSQNEQFGKGENDDNIWWDMDFGGGSGWVADVKKFVLDNTPTQDPVIPPEQTGCEKEVERLKTENKGLTNELTALKSQVEKLENELKLQKDRVAFLEDSLKERDKEIKELQVSFDTLKIERDRLEKEKLEIQEQFDKYKQENNSSFVNPFVNFFVKVFDKIIDFIKRKVVK